MDVIKRLRDRIKNPKGKLPIIFQDFTQEAMDWREAVANDDNGDALYALDARLDTIRRASGLHAAQSFAAVAAGQQTPLKLALAPFFREKRFAKGYSDDITRSVGWLADWLEAKGQTVTVEAVTRRIAGEFIHERMIVTNMHPKSANRAISCLTSYWTYLGKRWGQADNPWTGQSIERRAARSEADLQEGPQSAAKRPFTDDEVKTLLAGVGRGPVVLKGSVATVLPDFCQMAALTGMRVDEIAGLRVRDVGDSGFAISKSKTTAGFLRTVPVHPDLAGIIATRIKDKKPGEYLFHELPEQKADSKRGRGAPVSQVFTRERRRLKVDERPLPGQRQSNTDFHSFRRWFVRKAADALVKGVQGYSVWTIAEVVGHAVENASLEGIKLPLGLTMSTYAGAASEDAKRACVRAVKLPG
ncbi:tyrosine-type recombinase/integrase [Bosea sp. AS-1]|uniref:tyrosine-type recombinase/integrase n=1 Tax=Bosea sp. AS-1 TaxID=2015316 RepID=UPI0012FDBB4A|nr:tyrosine-type recombinase/integrase [Bosea sp. AS-1]